MDNLCLKIISQDRIGLVLDISTILNRYHINITYLNVLPNIMYLEVDTSEAAIEKILINEINKIPQVMSISRHILVSKKQISDSDKQLSLKNAELAFKPIIHQGKSMNKLINTAKQAALSSSTILLLGESGTGKELFAKAIHDASPRSKFSFLPINCAAIPETLLESELFGYEEGSFTGASKKGKKGLFEEAHQGTLFLDEIAELPMHFQVKLLRVLQEKKIKRIGGVKEIPIDVRIIAATHQDLNKKIQNNQFREDLFYRLNVLPLYIPALRHRKEDILCLAQSLLHEKCKQLNIKKKSFSQEAINKLINYSWPGNIRELENIIERLIHLTSHDHIQEQDIDLKKSIDYLQENTNCCATSFSIEKKLKDILDDCERAILCDAIEKYGTSRQIGKKLGLSHTAVLNRIKKHNIYIKTEVYSI